MIKFFRRIRQRLLSENRVRKYLLYAIGEIILVVIGILIALQINNWNDSLKERTSEKKILMEILSNLEQDLVEIQSDISVMDSVNNGGKDVAQFLMNESVPSENFFSDISKLRVNPHFDPNKSGYNLLVSKGVEIIRNDSLRGNISKLYESLYTYYYRYEEERTQFKLSQINPVLLKYFEWDPLTELTFFGLLRISTSSYSALRDDPDFIKLVYAIIFENTLVQNRAQQVERGIEALIHDVKKELLMEL